VIPGMRASLFTCAPQMVQMCSVSPSTCLDTEKYMRGQRMRQKIVRREGRTSLVFVPRPLDGRPMLPGNRQNSMVRAGFSSERKAQERV